jgi:holliday junction DNA helicase RuvA
MIAHIRGQVFRSGTEWIVVDVSGIGYKVFVTPAIRDSVCSSQGEIFLHTVLIVREDSQTLYGFTSIEELEMFNLLISVSRIGPALAMKIIGTIPPETIALAIINKDEKVLLRVPGIGSRSAQRLMLEMEDKMKARYASKSQSTIVSPEEDGVLGLVSLGFDEGSAREAVSKVTKLENCTGTADIIKKALLLLRKKG